MKVISAAVKANKNNKKQKIWQLYYLTNFYKVYVQNLKYNIKGACIFHFIFVGILSILILSIMNMEEGGRGLLNKENLLSTTKVISRHPVHLGENL